MKRNKLQLVIITFLCLGSTFIHAQDYHTYLKFDVGGGGEDFLAAALVAPIGNYIAKKNIVDSYLLLNQHNVKEDGIPVRISRPLSERRSIKDYLFDEIYGGIKLGYQSYNMSKFNWAVYGSAHYRAHIFDTTFPTALYPEEHKLHLALLGVGFVGTFGEISSPVRIQLEAALRYEIPVYYNGPNDESKEFLNSGCSYFLAAKYGRPTGYVNFGLFADIPCYNMFKDGGAYFTKPEVKIKSYGIIFSLNLWRVIHGSGK